MIPNFLKRPSKRAPKVEADPRYENMIAFNVEPVHFFDNRNFHQTIPRYTKGKLLNLTDGIATVQTAQGTYKIEVEKLLFT